MIEVDGQNAQLKLSVPCGGPVVDAATRALYPFFNEAITSCILARSEERPPGMEHMITRDGTVMQVLHA